jgi:hypothetical protein
MKTGDPVTYTRYEAAAKGYRSYPATLLTAPDGDGRVQLFFYHDDGKKHLGGADWSDALIRADNVGPEKGHIDGVAFWSPLSSPSTDAKKLRDFLMANFKNETGNETPEDCAIRLLGKLKTTKK